MKSTTVLIALGALVASTGIAATSFAGPGPGVPGLGERVEETLAAKPFDRGDRDAPYALTGSSDRMMPASSGPLMIQHYGRGGHKPMIQRGSSDER